METKTETIIESQRILEPCSQYEIIENERIISRNLRSLKVSGALISMTIFKNVKFEDCDFFACRFENCEFIDCDFSNCNFSFTNIIYCDFHFSKFENIYWDISPISKSLFSRCSLDNKTTHFIAKNKNRVMPYDQQIKIDEHTEKINKIAA